MKILKLISTLAFISIFGWSCKSKKSVLKDKPDSGTINISVDESFRPAIEVQIKMYELSYPNAHINVTYKSEADCLKDFFKDSSNRLIIIGRGLNSKEEHYMIDSLGYNPGCNAVASDAVTILLNNSNQDSLFSLSTLKEQLQGKFSQKKEFVFDGLNATSTVRFIKDSILNGENYDTSVVMATGVFNSGSNIGAMISALFVPWCIAYFGADLGWKMSFIITGSVGFLWLIFWFLIYDTPSKHKKLSKEEYDYIDSDDKFETTNNQSQENKTTWGKLFSFKQTWAFFFGKFMTDGIWWFYLFWLPDFLKKLFHMTTLEVRWPCFIVYGIVKHLIKVRCIGSGYSFKLF